MRIMIFFKSNSLTTHKYFQNIITDSKHGTCKYFLFIQWPIYIYLVPTIYQVFLLGLGHLAGTFFPHGYYHHTLSLLHAVYKGHLL